MFPRSEHLDRTENVTKLNVAERHLVFAIYFVMFMFTAECLALYLYACLRQRWGRLTTRRNRRRREREVLIMVFSNPRFTVLRLLHQPRPLLSGEMAATRMPRSSLLGSSYEFASFIERPSTTQRAIELRRSPNNSSVEGDITRVYPLPMSIRRGIITARPTTQSEPRRPDDSENF